MNEKTATPSSKTPSGGFVKRNVSYPMLLLAIAWLGNIKTIIASVSSLFHQPHSMLVAVLKLLAIIGPLVILVCSWIYRTKNQKTAKKIIAVVSLCLALVQAFFVVRECRPLYYQITSGGRFISDQIQTLLNRLCYTFLYGILSILLFRDRSKSKLYITICAMHILWTAAFGVMKFFSGTGSIFSSLFNVLHALYFLYMPRSFEEESSGEITKGKVKTLIAIVVAALVLPLIINIGSGFGSSGGTHERTCASCGRSFEAGDAAGNYMNIAKTGFCNNCDDNREFFEWILD